MSPTASLLGTQYSWLDLGWLDHLLIPDDDFTSFRIVRGNFNFNMRWIEDYSSLTEHRAI